MLQRSSPDLRRPIALPSLIAATALLLGVCRLGLGALAALGGDALVRLRVMHGEGHRVRVRVTVTVRV